MLALGCDQGGFTLKKEIMVYLSEKGIAYQDMGTYSEASVDYPDIARKVAAAVLSGSCEKGILVCGTGIGVSITANRYPGIRAALCHDVYSAKATRAHNDANILAMGGRVIGPGLCMDILEAFLTTPFSQEERHIRRVEKIERASYEC